MKLEIHILMFSSHRFTLINLTLNRHYVVFKSNKKVDKMFVGREEELAQLRELKKRKVAGIIVCCGRRRIGKSTLIEHFGERTRFLEFYGLAPREKLTNKDQLDHFGELRKMFPLFFPSD